MQKDLAPVTSRHISIAMILVSRRISVLIFEVFFLFFLKVFPCRKSRGLFGVGLGWVRHGAWYIAKVEP